MIAGVEMEFCVQWRQQHTYTLRDSNRNDDVKKEIIYYNKRKKKDRISHQILSVHYVSLYKTVK